jgi:protein ImuB
MQDAEHCAGSPDAPPETPIVLVARVRGALRIAAVDERARVVGLSTGLALADARARQPDLVAVPMDEAADRHWLERLAKGCWRYSPLVALAPPDAISIDVSGVLHLFNGETGLAEDLSTVMAGEGMTLRYAFAGTPEGALALARHAPLPIDDESIALHALPVAALNLDPQATLGLERAGLKTLGAIATRPAAAIAARFGKESIDALARIMGEASRPILALPYAKPLRFERRFAEPIAHQAMIANALLDLMQDAARTLEERGLGGRRFGLTMTRSDGAKHRLVIETGAPTRDPAMILRLFDERIGALADPLDPGFGYDSLTLKISITQALAPQQADLSGETKPEGALADLIDRLTTRLGRVAVQRLIPNDSHIPEQAQLALPAVECRTPQRWPTPTPGDPPSRPLFLFDPPQPVEVIAEVPDGPPHRFRWRRNMHEVRLFEGPERIAAEWWQRKGGEHPGKSGLTRDYYRIEDARGRRYWLFRHGLYDEKPDPRWFLHGLFA